MTRKPDLWAALCICAVALTRIPLRSHFLYDLDSVNFALGLQRFDPAAHQPHPPGYFLYICLARLVNAVFADANTALVSISVAASLGAAWMIYLLAKDWFGQSPARIAMLLFVVSPLCWFHGIVALTYIVEAFFAALIGFLGWRTYTGRAAYAIPLSILFALAAGFRPSTGLLLAPLWLLCIRNVRGPRFWLALCAAAATTFAWFIPMAEAAGGIGQYFGALSHLWRMIPGRRTTLSSPWLAVGRTLTIAWIFVLCFGFASIFVIRRSASEHWADRKKFFWTWVTPGLFFFAFVFLNFINSGYLLVLSPPVFAWLSSRVYAFLTAPDHRWLRTAAVLAGVTANCVFFFCAPLYCSYHSVRTFEREMAGIAQDFRTAIDPQHTLIVAFDSHFLGYRHAGYYLPGFVTVQYPEVNYPEGKRVFVMQGRDTRVLSSFQAARFERFVFFPLPEGAQYAEYLDSVVGKLPGKTLSTVGIGGRQVLTGPASAIPALFRATASFEEPFPTVRTAYSGTPRQQASQP